MTTLSRRHIFGLGAGLFATLTWGSVLPAQAANDSGDHIKAFTGGKQPTEGKVKLDLPEIAENGNTVPMTVTVESPMTDADYVKAVHVFADGNPLPGVVSYKFTPACGKAAASTRMRLAQTQNIVCIAEMSNGSLYTAKANIKVTIGGCGG